MYLLTKFVHEYVEHREVLLCGISAILMDMFIHHNGRNKRHAEKTHIQETRTLKKKNTHISH